MFEPVVKKELSFLMTVNIWNILGVQFILLQLFTAKIRTRKQVTKPITIAQLVV